MFKGIASPTFPSSTPMGQFGVGPQAAMLDSLTLTGPCRSRSPTEVARCKSQFGSHCRLMKGRYYTTISSASHEYQYTTLYPCASL